MPSTEASVERWRTALEPLLSDPASAAVLSDLDGTLAPIVARPELVAVSDRGRLALARIAARFGLCAIVTGRRPEVARDLVGIDEITYAGNHGFELLRPGAARATPSPALEGHLDDVARFVRSDVDAAALERAGIRVEDKGPIVALHWRGAVEEKEAERLVEGVATIARKQGLVVHLGRKVLELRPAVPLDKGIAIEALLGESPARMALYAGDDRTDLDGFATLVRLRDQGRLDHIVRVGVRSPEGPAELAGATDVLVADPGEVVELLEAMAG